jgi:Rrf2 family protein
VARPTNTQFAVAVHLLTLLGGAPGELLSSELLAGSVGANPVHVRRVLGALRRAGLVDSRPGVHGGWQLERAADTVTLGDVWCAVQGDDPLLGLHGAAPECPVGQRIQSALGEVDRRAARAVEEELARTTISDLARETRARELEAAPAQASR